MNNHAAYEHVLRAGGQRRQGLLFPRLRGHRFRAAVIIAVWGTAGILSTTGPGVAVNPDHIMLYFLFVMAGVVLLLLDVAAQDLPVAERAAARFEGWIRALFYNA